jgi:hypothetical protein
MPTDAPDPLADELRRLLTDYAEADARQKATPGHDAYFAMCAAAGKLWAFVLPNAPALARLAPAGGPTPEARVPGTTVLKGLHAAGIIPTDQTADERLMHAYRIGHRAALASAPPPSAWTPVGDGPGGVPELGRGVLLWLGAGYPVMGYAHRHKVDGVVRWYDRPGPEIGRDLHVTHWQRIQSPPAPAAEPERSETPGPYSHLSGACGP